MTGPLEGSYDGLYPMTRKVAMGHYANLDLAQLSDEVVSLLAALDNYDELFDRMRREERDDKIRKELEHLVRLIEPLEQEGSLNIPGLATLNGARRALNGPR